MWHKKMDHQLQEERIRTQHMRSLLEREDGQVVRGKVQHEGCFRLKCKLMLAVPIRTAGTENTKLQSSANYSVETATHNFY